MRSLVWSAIFSLLMMELVVVAVLAIPVPRRWRNWICMECSKLDLKKQMQPVLTAIGVGLVIAIVDSVNSLLLILDFVREDNHEENFIVRHLDKEKEYRTERYVLHVVCAFEREGPTDASTKLDLTLIITFLLCAHMKIVVTKQPHSQESLPCGVRSYVTLGDWTVDRSDARTC